MTTVAEVLEFSRQMELRRKLYGFKEGEQEGLHEEYDELHKDIGDALIVQTGVTREEALAGMISKDTLLGPEADKRFAALQEWSFRHSR